MGGITENVPFSRKIFLILYIENTFLAMDWNTVVV